MTMVHSKGSAATSQTGGQGQLSVSQIAQFSELSILGNPPIARVMG
jgi:hypothetical protein